MPAIASPATFNIEIYTTVLERRDMPSNATVVEGVQSSGNGTLQSSTIVGIVIALVCFVFLLLAFRFVPRSGCWRKKITPQQEREEEFLQRWMNRLSHSHTSEPNHRHPTRQGTTNSGRSTTSKKASLNEMEFTNEIPILCIDSTRSQNRLPQSFSNSPQDMLENTISKPPPVYSR